MGNLEKPTVKLTALLVVAEYHLLRYVVFARFVVWVGSYLRLALMPLLIEALIAGYG